jgi:hypothetical protein
LFGPIALAPETRDGRERNPTSENDTTRRKNRAVSKASYGYKEAGEA